MASGDAWRTWKASADAAYRAGSISEAIACYTEALAQLPPPPPPPPPPPTVAGAGEEDDTAEAMALAAAAASGDLGAVKSLLTRSAAADPDRSVLHANRAHCHLQMKDPKAAVSDCTAALAADGANIKARVRRALAREELGKYGLALEDLDAALRALPPPALAKVVTTARARVAVSKREDERLLREGKDQDVLVHAQQTLRFHFAAHLPASVVFGERFPVTVNVANEFGLYRARDFPAQDRGADDGEGLGGGGGGDGPGLGPSGTDEPAGAEAGGASYPGGSGGAGGPSIGPGGADDPASGEAGGATDPAAAATGAGDHSFINLTSGGSSGDQARIPDIPITFTLRPHEFAAGGAALGLRLHSSASGGAAEDAVACDGGREVIAAMPQEGRATVWVSIGPAGGGAAAAASRVLLEVAVSANVALSRPIMAVISLPFTAGPKELAAESAAQATESAAKFMAVGAANCRAMAVPVPGALDAAGKPSANDDGEVLVAESPGQLGIGGKVWDAALALVCYLRANDTSLLKRRRVLELGAGTGVVGMCCALLGAQEVVITDLPEVCELISVNIELNIGAKSGGCDCRAVPLAWAHPTPVLPPELSEGAATDTIILSDVVYDPVIRPPPPPHTHQSRFIAPTSKAHDPFRVCLGPLHPTPTQELYLPLIATLEALIPEGTGDAISTVLAYRHRNPESWRFWEGMKEAGFTCTDVDLGDVRGMMGGAACQDVRILTIER